MSQDKYIPVGDVMTADIKSIDGLSTASEVIGIMRENNISSVIIERRHEHDEYGLVTVRDIAEKVLVPDLSPERVNAYEIMRKPVLSVDVKMNIKYAVRLLARFEVTRALVLEDGKAVGIVTLRDMALRYLEAE